MNEAALDEDGASHKVVDIDGDGTMVVDDQTTAAVWQVLKAPHLIAWEGRG